MDFSSSAATGRGLGLSERVCVLAVIAIVAVVAVAYLPVADAPFVFDDQNDLVHNAAIHRLWPADWAAGSKRPLAWFTFAVSWAMGNGSPAPFRVANVLIHALAACMCFAVAREVLRSPKMGYPQDSATRMAGAAALIWAAHPLNTSSVTYVVHRYESLSALFYLVMLWALLRGAADSQRRRWWHFLSMFACAAGGLVKETLVTAPLAALVMDVIVLDYGWRKALRLRWPVYAGLTGALGPVLWLALTTPAAPSQRFGTEGVGPIEYLLSEPAVIFHYLRLAVWPSPLCIDYYDWPSVNSVREWGVSAWLAVGLVVASVGGTAKRYPAALPLAFVFIVLLPTSTVIPLRHELIAERRMYLPLSALSLAAVVLVRKGLVVVHAPRWTRGVALAVGVVGLLGATLARNAQYVSPTVLYANEVSTRPQNARAHIWYASYLADVGRLGDAAHELRTGLALDRDVPRVERQAARIADMQGKRREAAQWAMLALARDPDDDGAAQLAVAMLARDGNVQQACALLERKMRERPGDPQWIDWLAWYLATEPEVRDGKRALALSDQLIASGKAASGPRYGQTRAAALAAAGQYAEAIALVERLSLDARSSGNAELSERLSEQRSAYARGRPWSRVEPTLGN